MTKLNEKAMLVDLSIGQWNPIKYDRKITRETNQAHGASSEAGRYNKRLASKDFTAAYTKRAGEGRTIHYKLTLPWSDKGARILPVEMFDKYRKEMNKLRADLSTIADQIAADYPAARAQAQRDLNGMFNPADYPDEIRDCYYCNISIMPLPDSGDFRAKIHDDEAQEIRRQIETTTRTAQEQAARSVWERLHTVIEAAALKLSEPDRTDKSGKQAPPIFRDSLIENIRELCDILPALNITGDPQLDQLTKETREKLTAHSPEMLRASATSRKETAQNAADLLARVRQYTKP